MMAVTSLSSTGANALSILPVALSKASSARRSTGVGEDPRFCALVNEPPTITLLPASWMATTLPSLMFGVLSDGTSPTIVLWSGAGAVAGAASAGTGVNRVAMPSTAAPKADTERCLRIEEATGYSGGNTSEALRSWPVPT